MPVRKSLEMGAHNRHTPVAAQTGGLHANHSPILSGSEVVKTMIGKISCTIFRDLLFKYMAQDFFINADAGELKQALEKYQLQPHNISSPFIAMLLQYGNKKVLIDTGAGFSEQPFMTRTGPLVWKGRLQQLLQEENIKNADITDVIITHGHPDHIGAVFSSDNKLNFPNAVFHLHEDEWNFWHTAAAGNQPRLFKTFIEKNITPLKNGNLQLCRGAFAELVPGITAIKAEGHTPGQIALDIQSGNEHLLYISDAFLHPLHIERLDWETNYDWNHQKARQSRLALLELAHKNNMLVNAFHFDFPGLGRVEKAGTGWAWNYIH